MASPVQISVSQLNRLIGTPGAPVVLDVRTDEDFDEDPRLIPSARRHPFHSVETIAHKLVDVRVAVCCQKGLKISEGAAAILRCCGVSAEVVSGGQYAWRDAQLPLVPASSIPECHERGHTLWVTRLRPKIDRIACPWLIRRFVDPDAQFLFVSSSQVKNVAERFNATAFDMEDVFWSHRGDLCTFDTMLNEFALETEPLLRLADIVRAADTDRLTSCPEAAGLLAASLGLSRMYSDDLAQLDAGMALYDMFYRWARDATDEGHTWPSSGSS
jgi:rhodanese-related sulfurtransferase